MHAALGQGIQVDGQSRHQGLAFTGTHLGDFAAVQDHAADQLDIEVSHPEHAHACLANHGKSFRQQCIKGSTGLDTLAESICFGTQLSVCQSLHLRL